MTPAVFIDANVPIYAAGDDHPLKEPCARILPSVAEHPKRLDPGGEASIS